MIMHFLKIEQIHLVRILQGDKLFEIRKNDRCFKVGDSIQFLPLKSEVVDVYKYSGIIPDFIITSLYYGYGLQDGFVVLGIKREDAPQDSLKVRENSNQQAECETASCP